MDKKPEHMSKWLEKIEEDQNVKGIETLDDTIKNDYGRHWFLRQDLSPTIETGVYNSVTGRINKRYGKYATSANTTSQATHTLTCPAGRRYIVTHAGYSNGNRATVGSLTLNGGVITNGTTAGGAAIMWNMIGSTVSGQSNALAFNQSIQTLVLEEGDVLVITDGSFVAADTMRHYFRYEEVVL